MGATTAVVYPLRGASPIAVAARYLLSALITFAVVLRTRPHTIVVQSPPVPATVAGGIAARLVHARLVVDVHPGGFGLQGDGLSRRLRPITEQIVRRASATLVTDETLGEQVRQWGGTPLVVHEAAPDWTIDRPPSPEASEVLLVGTFARDEPVALAAEAARLCGSQIAMTGDIGRAPAELRGAPHVRLTGYLRGDAFVQALARCRAVLVLTTEATSVPRAGYEAVRALRPLIISDTPATRRAFPHAIHVGNTPSDIASALQQAAAPADETALRDARDELELRWNEQLSALRGVLDGTP